MPANWSEGDLRDYEERKKRWSSNNPTVPTTNMEQNTCYGGMGKEKVTRFNTQVSIRVHSKRRRLADSDGISAKAVIDGLVANGLFPDDTPKWVKEVRFTQEKVKMPLIEETIIYIEEV